jgi:hypothetical protein
MKTKSLMLVGYMSCDPSVNAIELESYTLSQESYTLSQESYTLSQESYTPSLATTSTNLRRAGDGHIVLLTQPSLRAARHVCFRGSTIESME